MQTSANERTSEPKSRLGYAIPIIKIAVSLGALILVALYVDPVVLWERLRHTSPLFLLIAVVLGIMQVLIVGLRWTLLARFVNHPEPAPSAGQFQSINFAGQFIGQFLPLLAADALRIVYAHSAGMLLRNAFISTAFDRGIALLLLAGICVVDVIVAPRFSQIPGMKTIFLLIAISCIAGITLVLIVGGKTRPAFLKHRVLRSCWELLASFRRLCFNIRVLIPVVLLGLSVHSISVTIFWLVCAGQGLGISIYDAMTIFPVVLFAVAVPISIAGWGVREGLIVALFSQMGISPESALAASLAFGTAILIAALPGAFALLNLPKPHRSQSPALVPKLGELEAASSDRPLGALTSNDK